MPASCSSGADEDAAAFISELESGSKGAMTASALILRVRVRLRGDREADATTVGTLGVCYFPVYAATSFQPHSDSYERDSIKPRT